MKKDSLAARLRGYRDKHGLRQVDVAKVLGVDEATIVNWEKAKTEPESRHYPTLISLLGSDHRPVETDVWKRVKRYRESLGLTQSEFAKLLEVNETTVWRWEQGFGILPKRLLRMMGEPIVFYRPNSKIKDAQLLTWKTRWEREA